jgi:DNA-binding PadR family transcriptional regulator
LKSEWRIADETRPRRYYVISPQGTAVLNQLKEEWFGMAVTMKKMLS